MTSTDAPGPARRRTRQRALVAGVLENADQLLTVQQVYQRLLGDGQPVGLATVYRTLGAMVRAGEIDAVRGANEWTYRRCSPSHHHHLTCRNCGRTVEISAAPLEEWAAAVAAEHGFSDVRHVIEIQGLCRDCQGAENH